MDRELRTAIGSTAQSLRRLLETEFLEQLEGTYDIHETGKIEDSPGVHLTPRERVTRSKIVGAIQYHQSSGLDDRESVARFVRDAAFTTLNRFVALKMLEARELVQQCITNGGDSTGYREFIGLAPGVERLSDGIGYRLYLESLFDELSAEVKVLFDRRDAASLLWPRHNTLGSLLKELNRPNLNEVWGHDETIGWFYQFFNSKEERQRMRDESQAPRNSRELAVRNQFFTPRYVVQFLVDNTVGRAWIEMTGKQTELVNMCDYFIELEDERPDRPLKDPRDFRILDPACGSGHFLLYSFDLLERMYREAWEHSLRTDRRVSLRETYSNLEELECEVPRLILEENLYGVDIDPRAAQIAALALWLRAQRSWRDAGVSAADRPRIRRTGIIVAEPMPGDADMIDEFAASLAPPLLADLFRQIVASMALAGEMGTLVRAEAELSEEIHRARAAFVSQRIRPQSLPGFEPDTQQDELDLSGIDDDAFFAEAEQRLVDALARYASHGAGAQSARRRLFADDAGQGVALLDLLRERFDVVLMNPPFGSGSLKAKSVFEKAYPRTKNDLYAAFVERGAQLLVSHGMLGAITSRTGFFLSSFQKFRQEVILEEAPPLVFADLGPGVLDGAMVEVAAYCLESVR
jgi:hypothetical protein